jgi:hypothetical protein
VATPRQKMRRRIDDNMHVWGRGNQREKKHLLDTGVDERIILRWIFRKRDESAWTGSIWLRI